MLLLGGAHLRLEAEAGGQSLATSEVKAAADKDDILDTPSGDHPARLAEVLQSVAGVVFEQDRIFTYPLIAQIA